MSEYIERELLKAFDEASEGVLWKQFHKFKGGDNVYPALACLKNGFLQSHVDDDSWYCLLQVHSPPEIGREYAMDDEIVTYFVFPEQGVAVSLRPGDIMMFNPQVYHCLSSCAKCNRDVFGCSMYLKTAVAGGNDNGL